LILEVVNNIRTVFFLQNFEYKAALNLHVHYHALGSHHAQWGLPTINAFGSLHDTCTVHNVLKVELNCFLSYFRRFEVEGVLFGVDRVPGRLPPLGVLGPPPFPPSSLPFPDFSAVVAAAVEDDPKKTLAS